MESKNEIVDDQSQGETVREHPVLYRCADISRSSGLRAIRFVVRASAGAGEESRYFPYATCSE